MEAVANTPPALVEEFIGSYVQMTRTPRVQVGFMVTGTRVLTRRLSGPHFSFRHPPSLSVGLILSRHPAFTELDL